MTDQLSLLPDLDRASDSRKQNLMDAVNGNATVNMYGIARCCSGICHIHEETF